MDFPEKWKEEYGERPGFIALEDDVELRQYADVASVAALNARSAWYSRLGELGDLLERQAGELLSFEEDKLRGSGNSIQTYQSTYSLGIEARREQTLANLKNLKVLYLSNTNVTDAGLLHLKDLIKLVNAGGRDVQSIVKPLLRVPERKPILRLLADMQRSFCHMALVKDEFGVTQGLVTQEDILEEIVGEIRDEFDSEELFTIRELGDGSYEVLGRVTVLDFNRESGWQVPAERGDTIGGLVFNTLERAPHKDERVALPGYEVVCIDVSGSRIARVQLIRMADEADEAGKRKQSGRKHVKNGRSGPSRVTDYKPKKVAGSS